MRKIVGFCGVVGVLLSAAVYAQEEEGTLRIISFLFTKSQGLSSTKVTCLSQDEQGFFWVGTEDGLNMFDGFNFISYKKSLGTPLSLESNQITSLFHDSHGRLWVGTMAGLAWYDAERDGFVRPSMDLPLEVLSKPCTAMAEDGEGALWFAFADGGVMAYHPLTRTLRTYDGDNSALPAGDVCDIKALRNGSVLLATRHSGLFVYEVGGGDTLRRYGAAVQTSDMPAIACVGEDGSGQIVVGTEDSGALFFDTVTGGFTAYPLLEDFAGMFAHSHVSCFYVGEHDYLWFGLKNKGVFTVGSERSPFRSWDERTALPDEWMKDVADSVSKYSRLIGGVVYAVASSGDGVVWIGTPDGLYQYEGGRLQRVYPSGGATAAINGIVVDKERLWLSTNNGLIAYTPAGGGTKHYTQANSGLLNDEYLPGAYYKSESGEVYFGGTEGVDFFNPAAVHDSVTLQKVYLRRLRLFNEPVALPRQLATMDTLVLQQSDKSFTLEYVAMGSFKPYSTVYACKLEGFDDDWAIYDYAQRSVTYTNLDPGTYVFRIKASSDPEVWGEEATTLVIRIEPTLWNTWWAKMLYVLASTGLLFLIGRLIVLRLKEKSELRIQRMQVQHQEELNNVKTTFFGNISHEFHTLLTLIISPLTRLISNIGDDEQAKTGRLILRNVERLQHFVNQILDIHSLEESSIPLHVRPIELVSCVSQSIAPFVELLQQKNIALTYNWKPDQIPVWYDPDQLDKALNNLLYNAYKFTPSGGIVNVSVSLQPNKNTALLIVKDNGIGMDSQTQAHIFDRFFQKNRHVYTGIGIGMHLTRSIVEAHKGTITLQSREGKGTTFRITIPLGNRHFTPQQLATDPATPPAIPALSPTPKSAESKTPTILLIDDNPDIRTYIQNELSPLYHIEQAPDGETGLQKAQQLLPDLIVTDIMMPAIDGISLCRQLKNNPHTNHIPIIILTARDDMPHRIDSLCSGADSYITKPFHANYLKLQIQNLLHNRQTIKQHFSPLNTDPQQTPFTGADRRLLTKTIQYIHNNLENPNLTVNAMSKHLGISRVHLNRRIKSLTKQTPLDLIKSIRMKQAAHLLSTTSLTISEVAYRVGYNSLSYFSASFANHFGLPPSAYGKQTQNNP